MNFLRGFIAVASGFARPVMQLVRPRWARTLIWALAACLVVFFYGDAIHLRRWQPLDSDTARLEACVAIVIAWAGYNIFMWVRDRRVNKTMINAIVTDGEPANKPDLSAQEVEQIRSRLQDAMTQLRHLVGGRRGYIYQLPWYVMIGPPGSGKTTALLNSGLRFPLAETMGRDPVRGVGGTRNCDWWFTEDAILLDTAGRYTTQDSDPEVDQKAWAGFLSLLKIYRPLQPINGVIVALSLEDVACGNPQERLANAQAIRARLGELTRAFGSRFPIYVLLTKADLMAGFVQFYDAYSRTDREQVWGMTFPLDDGKPETQAAASRFDIEFDLLLTRMNAIVLERLQQETDIQRRGLIFGFPIQVATLKEPIHEILDEIFASSKFGQRPLLRGVYFTSSTQSGAPIDRMMHAMASTFGMDAPRLAAFAGQEKSYFLTRLLNTVVFAEANVVAADPRARRRIATTRAVAVTVATVLVLGLLGTWSLAYSQNKALVAAADQQIATYQHTIADVPTTDVSDTDFARVVPPLDQLRDGPAVLRHDATYIWIHAGMDQSAKLQSQYDTVYTRALNHLLLPRVLVFLQKQMRNGNDKDDDFKVAAMRVYLGLGGAGRLDRPFVRKWMAAEWAALYPDATQAGLRVNLNRHFATLLDRPIEPIALDATLIATVREQIQKQPVAARAYTFLLDSTAVRNLPNWTVQDSVGAVADRAFVRVSNAPLSDGIPGLYTRDGYLKVFLPGLHDAVAQAAKERWVYGDDHGGRSDQAITAQVVALYRGDFTARWTALLNDLRIRPLVDLPQSVLILTALSGPDSVLQKLLDNIVHVTDLSPPSADAKDADSERIKALIAAAVPSDAPEEQPFAPLRSAMAGGGGQPSQIAGLMQTLNTLYAEMSRASNAPRGVANVTETEGGLNDANQKLLSESRQMPSPVDVWLSGLTTGVTSVSSGTAKNAITQAWNASSQRFCAQAVNGRYPFARRARTDISVDDFSHLFGPNGVMARFFDENLRQFVNTSRHPWEWEYNSAQGVSSAFLAEFERADLIKQAFFGGGSASFHYEVTPDTLDSSANEMTLDIGGQTLTYAHGPVRPTTMQWPAPDDGGARLDVEPSGAGDTLSIPGAWSAFRLFDQGKTSGQSRDSFIVSFLVGARRLSFAVKSDSVLNPFTLRDLRLFRCPGAL